uniref:Uncharacterized protein n=1 Tax=Helianthus annuus TaxID=4232 RepID=A0A251V3T1_HELAN
MSILPTKPRRLLLSLLFPVVRHIFITLYNHRHNHKIHRSCEILFSFHAPNTFFGFLPSISLSHLSSFFSLSNSFHR